MLYPSHDVRARRTPLPELPPVALTREYRDNLSEPAQARAFASCTRIATPEGFAKECALMLDPCLSPVPGFRRFIEESHLPFRAHAEFRKADLDARQALYQQLAERIWGPERLAREVAS